MGLFQNWNSKSFIDKDSKSFSRESDCIAFTKASRFSTFFVFFMAIFFISCSQAPNLSDEPEIEFLNISRTVLPQGTSGDEFTQVTIGFSDGDGNLGEDEELNLFFVDTRDSFETEFGIPFIPEEGAGNGITGEIRVRLPTSCCIFPNEQPPCTPSDLFPTDTVVYEVYLIDRSDNPSNRVTLPPIILLCD